MKIIRTLNITSDEFYDHLESKLLELANNTRTGEAVYTPADLKAGFQISRGAKEASFQTSLTVTDYVRNHHYEATAESVAGTIQMSYRTEPGDEGLKVTFEQSSIDGREKKHGKLFRGFSDALFLSRMSNSLYDIQNEIMRKRKN